jgi:hypothetical protein
MGGAVCFDKGSKGFFKQGSFKNNVATVSGGAVFEDQNVCVTYIETNFATNKAANGGAVGVSTGSSADVQYSLFDTDSATVSERKCFPDTLFFGCKFEAPQKSLPNFSIESQALVAPTYAFLWLPHPRIPLLAAVNSASLSNGFSVSV